MCVSGGPGVTYHLVGDTIVSRATSAGDDQEVSIGRVEAACVERTGEGDLGAGYEWVRHGREVGGHVESESPRGGLGRSQEAMSSTPHHYHHYRSDKNILGRL
jgi:hypothetical protein